MTQARRYDFKLTNTFRSKGSITEESSTTPLFELDLGWLINDRRTKASHSIVLLTASHDHDDESRVVGTADFSFSTLEMPIHIAFREPDHTPNMIVCEGLICLNMLMTNPFELSLDLGGSLGRRTFYWKRTHGKESGAVISRHLDWLKLKMVERETQRVVARFVHNPIPGWKRGYFLLEEYDGGSNWLILVMLSGTAVLEYSRKLSGFPW